MSTRSFHFQEGTSDKFWQIRVDGKSHTVQYGRAGTAGQSQTKEFASEDEARRSADKLIQEKLRKGYVEDGSSAAVSQVSTSVAPIRPAAPAKPQIASTPEPEAATSGAPASEPTVPASKVVEAIPIEPAAEVTRSIDLEPADWARATWRPRTPLQRPPTPEFDLEAALQRLSKMKVPQYAVGWDWSQVGIPLSMTRQEAEFWIKAILRSDRKAQPAGIAAELKARAGQPPALNLEELPARVTAEPFSRAIPELVLTMGHLVSATEVVRFILRIEQVLKDNASPRGYYGHNYTELCEGFRSFVLPYVHPGELSGIRDLLRPAILPGEWPAQRNAVHYWMAPASFLLAAMVGLSRELQTVVDTWSDDLYGEEWLDAYLRPQEILFGLADPREVESQMRRLKLRPRNAEQIEGWLAHTEYAALDWVASAVTAQTNREEAERLFGAFARVHAPEAAPYMLQLILDSKVPRQAREWLEANPVHAAVGLAPVAAGRGRAAEQAQQLLSGLRRRGEAAAVEAGLRTLAEEPQARVRALLTEAESVGEPLDEASVPEWLRAGAAGGKRAKLPGWITPGDLPPLRIGGRRLGDAHVQTVLAALAQSKLEAPHLLIPQMNAAVDPGDLDRFGWRLFERWLADGAPSKEKWAMLAVGLLGTDVSALKLAPMIRVWPGEAQHQRAVTGLECLRAIGTDTALMQINGIAQKVAFKGLKTKAGECMEGIAKDRGLTRPELEDRIVPTCDLDERGSRTFGFGPRQFRFVLGPGMKPMVREADGKIKPDLPKPNSKDDAEQSAKAVEEWKLLKKQVAEVAKTQGFRLEQAMVTGRRWKRDDFESLLVRHPLMTNLVRLLVWGAYYSEGALGGTFRVTEDLTYGDSVDDVFDLEPYAEVGIVHSLHLNEETRASWGELLSDYEIAPPFPQLGRTLLSLEAEEQDKQEIRRFENTKLPPQTVVFTLEKLGWLRGIPEDAGVFYSHSKPFYGAGVTAIVEYEEGVPVGYMDGWQDVAMNRCYFIPEIWNPTIYPDHKIRVPLSEVDPVVISEVLADLTLIASKAK